MGTIVSRSAFVRSSRQPADSCAVQPPELEILEIGDLSTDRFRGIFRLTYSGDAYIVLQTRVQVGPGTGSFPKNFG